MGSRRREARGCGESPPGCVRPGPRALPSEAAAPTCQPLHQRMTHPSPWLVSLARSASTSTLDGRPRAPSGLAGCLPLCGQSPRVWAQQARSFAGIRQLRKEQEPAAWPPPWPVRVAVATRSPGTQSAALAPSVTSGGQSGVPSGGRSGGAAGTFILAWARKCSCTRRVYDTINSWTNVGFSSVQGGSVWSLSSPPTTATPGLLTGPETRAIGARGSLALCAPSQADLAHAPATWTHHRAAAAGR